MQTNEYYFHNLKDFYLKYNRIPKFKELTAANGLPARQTLYKRFGGMDNFVKMSGLEFKRDKKRIIYNKEMVLHAVREFTNKNGRIPRLSDMTSKNNCPTSTVIYSLFDSWNEVIELFKSKMPLDYKSAKIRKIERICGLTPQFQYLHSDIDFDKLVNILEIRQYKHLPYYKSNVLERKEVRIKKDYVYSLGKDIQTMNTIWLSYVKSGKGKEYYQ